LTQTVRLRVEFGMKCLLAGSVDSGMKYIPRFGMMHVLFNLQYELRTAKGMKCRMNWRIRSYGRERLVTSFPVTPHII